MSKFSHKEKFGKGVGKSSVFASVSLDPLDVPFDNQWIADRGIISSNYRGILHEAIGPDAHALSGYRNVLIPNSRLTSSPAYAYEIQTNTYFIHIDALYRTTDYIKLRVYLPRTLKYDKDLNSINYSSYSQKRIFQIHALSGIGSRVPILSDRLLPFDKSDMKNIHAYKGIQHNLKDLVTTTMTIIIDRHAYENGSIWSYKNVVKSIIYNHGNKTRDYTAPFIEINDSYRDLFFDIEATSANGNLDVDYLKFNQNNINFDRVNLTGNSISAESLYLTSFTINNYDTEMEVRPLAAVLIPVDASDFTVDPTLPPLEDSYFQKHVPTKSNDVFYKCTSFIPLFGEHINQNTDDIELWQRYYRGNYNTLKRKMITIGGGWWAYYTYERTIEIPTEVDSNKAILKGKIDSFCITGFKNIKVYIKPVQHELNTVALPSTTILGSRLPACSHEGARSFWANISGEYNSSGLNLTLDNSSEIYIYLNFYCENGFYKVRGKTLTDIKDEVTDGIYFLNKTFSKEEAQSLAETGFYVYYKPKGDTVEFYLKVGDSSDHIDDIRYSKSAKLNKALRYGIISYKIDYDDIYVKLSTNAVSYVPANTVDPRDFKGENAFLPVMYKRAYETIHNTFDNYDYTYAIGELDVSADGRTIKPIKYSPMEDVYYKAFPLHSSNSRTFYIENLSSPHIAVYFNTYYHFNKDKVDVIVSQKDDYSEFNKRPESAWDPDLFPLGATYEYFNKVNPVNFNPIDGNEKISRKYINKKIPYLTYDTDNAFDIKLRLYNGGLWFDISDFGDLTDYNGHVKYYALIYNSDIFHYDEHYFYYNRSSLIFDNIDFNQNMELSIDDISDEYKLYDKFFRLHVRNYCLSIIKITLVATDITDGVRKSFIAYILPLTNNVLRCELDTLGIFENDKKRTNSNEPGTSVYDYEWYYTESIAEQYFRSIRRHKIMETNIFNGATTVSITKDKAAPSNTTYPTISLDPPGKRSTTEVLDLPHNYILDSALYNHGQYSTGNMFNEDPEAYVRTDLYKGEIYPGASGHYYGLLPSQLKNTEATDICNTIYYTGAQKYDTYNVAKTAVNERLFIAGNIVAVIYVAIDSKPGIRRYEHHEVNIGEYDNNKPELTIYLGLERGHRVIKIYKGHKPVKTDMDDVDLLHRELYGLITDPNIYQVGIYFEEFLDGRYYFGETQANRDKMGLQITGTEYLTITIPHVERKNGKYTVTTKSIQHPDKLVKPYVFKKIGIAIYEQSIEPLTKWARDIKGKYSKDGYISLIPAPRAPFATITSVTAFVAKRAVSYNELKFDHCSFDPKWEISEDGRSAIMKRYDTKNLNPKKGSKELIDNSINLTSSFSDLKLRIMMHKSNYSKEGTIINIEVPLHNGFRNYYSHYYIHEVDFKRYKDRVFSGMMILKYKTDIHNNLKIEKLGFYYKKGGSGYDTAINEYTTDAKVVAYNNSNHDKLTELRTKGIHILVGNNTTHGTVTIPNGTPSGMQFTLDYNTTKLHNPVGCLAIFAQSVGGVTVSLDPDLELPKSPSKTDFTSWRDSTVDYTNKYKIGPQPYTPKASYKGVSNALVPSRIANHYIAKTVIGEEDKYVYMTNGLPSFNMYLWLEYGSLSQNTFSLRITGADDTLTLPTPDSYVVAGDPSLANHFVDKELNIVNKHKFNPASTELYRKVDLQIEITAGVLKVFSHIATKELTTGLELNHTTPLTADLCNILATKGIGAYLDKPNNRVIFRVGDFLYEQYCDVEHNKHLIAVCDNSLSLGDILRVSNYPVDLSIGSRYMNWAGLTTADNKPPEYSNGATNKFASNALYEE